MNRLEEIRNIVDNLLNSLSNFEERRGGFNHLYGVSSICSLLALKRGLNVEICAVSGMLHDISSYKNGYTLSHAELSSIEARKILNETNSFKKKEIDTICHSIAKHSDKENIDDVYDELLKDADVLEHYLYNIQFKVNQNEQNRLNGLFKELGLPGAI